jgi:hypothetical protein
MQTQAEMNLTGPTGQVYALAVGNELLFAATQVNFGLSLILISNIYPGKCNLIADVVLHLVQDGRILAWRFSAATNCFEPAAALEGHQLAVVSLIVGGMRLYSGSMDKTIRVRTKENFCTIVHTFLDTVDVGAFGSCVRQIMNIFYPVTLPSLYINFCSVSYCRISFIMCVFYGGVEVYNARAQ